MNSFSPPVDVASYFQLALIFCFIGFPLMAWFIVYEMTTSAKNRSLVQEVILAVTSSTLLGTGLFFLLLWSGVYV
eukprot:gene2927-4766_t